MEQRGTTAGLVGTDEGGRMRDECGPEFGLRGLPPLLYFDVSRLKLLECGVMEKELRLAAEAVCKRIVQLKDSL
jgi:hypothetical protein